VLHQFEGEHVNEPLVGHNAMNGREHIVDDRDQSSVRADRSHFAMRAHPGGLRAVQILNHPDAECLVPLAGAESGSTYNEIDRQLSFVLEPLRAAATGREAILDMLRRVLSASLPTSYGPSTFLPAVLHFSVETDSNPQTSRERRHSLRSQILKRLEHSVSEGELPEGADIEVLSCLCMSFVSGLVISLQDGISKALLEGSIALFVESVGFHKVRAAKRRLRSTPPVVRPVLTLVKR
jgi:hypothetical protein